MMPNSPKMKKIVPENLSESLDFERNSNKSPIEKIGIGVKGKIRDELKKVEDEYRNLKGNAKRQYYDPIDYPSDLKYRLSSLSAKKAELKRQLDPEKAANADKKRWDRERSKSKTQNEKLKDLKKEIIEKYPDIKIAEKIFSTYGYNKKKGQKMLDDSDWENISRLREYVLDARAFTTQRKKQDKITGRINW